LPCVVACSIFDTDVVNYVRIYSELFFLG